MSMPTEQSRASGPPAGLCDTCAHQQRVRNTRGSVFSLCRRSREDPTYPRYPRLPVLACRGHEPRLPDERPSERPPGPPPDLPEP